VGSMSEQARVKLHEALDRAGLLEK
jgi:hypothetical protein